LQKLLGYRKGEIYDAVGFNKKVGEDGGKYIDMRRFAYKNQKQGYNYLMRMDEYTGFLESMERMYKLMLNRGLAIINIEKAVSIYDNNTIFREIEL
jgi:hypothetical protein